MDKKNVDLLPAIDQIGIGRILVTGDVMLDSYWYGTTSRISPEAPVPVVKIVKSESRPGGSANVAMNIGSLGVACDLLAITGDDSAADQLAQHLRRFPIIPKFQRIEHLNTITKLRVISQHQQLIRIDHESEFPHIDRSRIESDYQTALERADVVVISDYAKGTLASTREWVAKAAAKGKPVIIDPKGTDFEKYRNATLITPNTSEFEQVAGKCKTDKELIGKAENLIRRLNLKALLVTRGEKGMTLVFPDGAFIHVPAQAKEVFDVTGAGDTVVAVLAASIAAGLDLETSVRIANYAAGIVVSKLGTAFVTQAEIKEVLRREIYNSMAPLEKGILTLDRLTDVLAESRKRGERIVMTNGCFDILHPGHVTYLQKAKQLGDRLIVAVNSDGSVKRLKGDSRPVNPAGTRMAMLNALESTDWIIEFDEDTPENLITRILPDVLVKGGDYRIEEIAGSKAVLQNGGRVELMDYVEGYSTTRLIQKIKE